MAGEGGRWWDIVGEGGRWREVAGEDGRWRDIVGGGGRRRTVSARIAPVERKWSACTITGEAAAASALSHGCSASTNGARAAVVEPVVESVVEPEVAAAVAPCRKASTPEELSMARLGAFVTSTVTSSGAGGIHMIHNWRGLLREGFIGLTGGGVTRSGARRIHRIHSLRNVDGYELWRGRDS